MPLTGITVLDTATAMAGPYCATLLAELGARVIKVEQPVKGDITRNADRYVGGQSGYFIGLNRGKEGISVDLKSNGGQEIIRRLASRVDVFLENFRPGLMASWGLDYSALHAINPRLIYCSISAFGDAARLEKATGNDMVCQAYSGLMDLTGEPDGDPQRVGVPAIDAAAGFQAAIGILAILFRRERTGCGNKVAVSLLEAAYSLLPNYLTSVMSGGAEFVRAGSGHTQFAPCETYRTGDGLFLTLCAFHDRSWNSFCEAIHVPELVDDNRFASNALRVGHRRELRDIVERQLATRSRDEWIAILEAADVTCAPVLSLRESLARFREAIPSFTLRLEQSEVGPVETARPALRFAVDPPRPLSRAGPSLGEDTDRILDEIGYGRDEIARLRGSGVV